MDYEKQLTRLMRRKSVIVVLGDNYVLSDNQRNRLCRLLDKYKTPKAMENMLTTIAYFVLYDLTNYTGRYRRLAGTNGTSLYTHILRYGKAGAEKYKQESRAKTRHFKNTTRYWLDAGYSMIDAQNKVRDIQTRRGQKAGDKLRGTSLYTVRSKLYWLNLGYSDEEAAEKVRLIQTSNGLEYYKSRYPDDYLVRFEDRIASWQASLHKNNNMDLVNLKKSHSVEGGLARGLTHDEALAWYDRTVEHMRKIRRLPSMISQKMCQLLHERLGGTCYYSELNFEKKINNHRVDFYHEESQTVVEFYGDFYHRNPNKFKECYAHGISSQQRWADDAARQERILKSNKVSRFLIVWESDFRRNPQEEINRVIGEINGN
jgi:hypothetical protein